MEGQYNTRSPAVKRLMREAQELSEPTVDFYAQPLEDNLFEWHFTVRGPSETDFEGGVYHGRILLPPEYPMKPPNIIVLTPNGRFEIGKKICLSISGHHPESWQPSWSIRTALLAIIGFMPTPGQGTIGSLDYTPEERKRLARKSNQFECETCGSTSLLLLSPEEGTASSNEEVKEIVRNMSFRSEDEVQKLKEPGEDTKDPEEESAETSERKAASKAAQEKFRERLQQRTRGMTAQLANVQPFHPTPKSTTSSTTPLSSSSQAPVPQVRQRITQQQQQRPAQVSQPQAAAGGHRSYLDWLVLLIVVAIAVIVYRRMTMMQGMPEGGTTE